MRPARPLCCHRDQVTQRTEMTRCCQKRSHASRYDRGRRLFNRRKLGLAGLLEA